MSELLVRWRLVFHSLYCKISYLDLRQCVFLPAYYCSRFKMSDVMIRILEEHGFAISYQTLSVALYTITQLDVSQCFNISNSNSIFLCNGDLFRDWLIFLWKSRLCNMIFFLGDMTHWVIRQMSNHTRFSSN